MVSLHQEHAPAVTTIGCILASNLIDTIPISADARESRGQSNLIDFCAFPFLIGFIYSIWKEKEKKYTSKSSGVDIVLTEMFYLCKCTKYFAEIISVKNED